MTASEIAIVISVVSVSIAGFSLGWNVYRDVILKAKVKVDIIVGTIIQHGISERPEYIIITATNYGPGPVKLSMVQMKNSSWWRKLLRKENYAVVLQDYENPMSGQLPHKLEVGERIDLLFHYNASCILKEGWSHIGISDYFGRTHWAASKKVKAATCSRNKDSGNIK